MSKVDRDDQAHTYTDCHKTSRACRSCQYRSYCQAHSIECHYVAGRRNKRPLDAAETQTELFNMEPRAQGN